MVYHIKIETNTEIANKEVEMEKTKIKDKIQTIYLKYTFCNNLNNSNENKNSENKNSTIENISKDMALKYYSKPKNLIIERCKNGKPYFLNETGENDIFFNGTHSKDLIAVAMSDKLIGVDGEFIKKRNFFDIAKEYFSFNEYKLLKSSSKLEIDFYTLWTLKESYIKTFGKKIFDIKDSIEVNLEERAIYNVDNLFFATFSIDNCYIISVSCNMENVGDYNDIIIKTSGLNLDLIFAYPEFPQIELTEI